MAAVGYWEVPGVAIVALFVRFCPTTDWKHSEVIYRQSEKRKIQWTSFFIQMAAIEQCRFEREEKWLEKEDGARKKEKQQIAEQRELDHQRMAEQHDYFARLLEEVRRPQERTPPPLPTPRLPYKNSMKEATIWQHIWTLLKPQLW